VTVTLTFTVKFNADYHISTGHGLGFEADSALLRDVDGIPVIRGTTLTGLLRDGLWGLLDLKPLKTSRKCQASGLTPNNDNPDNPPTYCKQYDPQQDECPICLLFGTPHQPKHWRIHSARPKDQGVLYAEKQSQVDGQIVHRVRIDPATRRAEPRKLFSQEEGSSDLIFEFKATCQANGTAAKDEAALLVAAARFVRQLGRSRRRGQGECLLSLRKVTGLDDIPVDGEQAQAALLAHFEKRWLNDEQTIAVPNSLPSTASYPQTTHTRYRLIIRLDEPLLISWRAEAGNQFQSRAIIPGSTVRGAFAWRAAQYRGLSPSQNQEYQQTSDYQDFVDVFMHGHIQFPYLYPARYEQKEIHPTIPAPLDWLTCKVFPGLGVEMHGMRQFKGNPSQKCPVTGCDESVKPLSHFVTIQRRPVEYMPELRHEMHVRIAPESGRAAEGNLFTYVALEARQYLTGELIGRDTTAWQHFWELTGLESERSFSLYLGRARQRGYGRVTAWLQPLSDQEEEKAHTWIYVPFEDRVPDAIPDDGETITLTLLTDTIVTDSWGHYPAGFEERPAWLSDWLNLPVEVENSFAKVEMVDGFNGHLGMPRWRDLALVAGSVAYIRCPKGETWPDDWRARLARVEQQGIGLRRNEGFGQIAFNHPIYRTQDYEIRSDIELPEAMNLVDTDETLPLVSKAKFEKEWQKVLGGFNP